MNILVIGNGFDLAHGLPTKYTDFLDFCKVIAEIYFMDQNTSSDAEKVWNKLNIRNNINGERLKGLFVKIYKVRVIEEFKPPQDVLSYHISTNNIYDKFYKYINNNIWVDYFLHHPMYQKENWIDFEREISSIIQSLDNDMKLSKNGHFTLEDKIEDFTNKFLKQKYYGQYAKRTYKELIDRLLDDLNKLIRALEIYLCEYVDEKDIKVTSPDIMDITIQINSDTHTALPTKVLSFNYTDTFEKIYDKDKNIKYDYIHGKADISNTIESNNMVLGIDEYLGKKRRNKDVEFIAFKKYYQRIHKQTGCKYKEWVEEIRKSKGPFKNSNKEWHNLYIFGHSLDVTDKDILCDLILNNNVHTTIFYHNKEVMGQQIANLVKVIGQDELIRRTGGSKGRIEFVPQKPMVPIKS